MLLDSADTQWGGDASAVNHILTGEIQQELVLGSYSIVLYESQTKG